MTGLLLLPAILSLLILGAHFLRMGAVGFVPPLVVLLFLLRARRRWVMRATQAVLLLGAVEWLVTLSRNIDARQMDGRPWERMAVILGGTAAACVLGALLFETRRLRARYAPARLSEPAASVARAAGTTTETPTVAPPPAGAR